MRSPRCRPRVRKSNRSRRIRTTAIAAAQTAPAESAAIAAAPPQTAPAGANGNAFNPAMSVVLNGAYAHGSLDPDRYYRAGFALGGGSGPPAQGLSIAESEVALSANIDEKFYGQLILTAQNDKGQDHIGVENAFIETTALPNGFSVRAGRFYSDIGYLNSHHAHTDNFYDRPLAYQAFLGNQYGDDGVQVRWLAPTPIFLEFGAEAFAGNHFPSGGGGHGGVGVFTGFVHAGGDIGDDTSWLAGASMLNSQTVGAEDGFSGDNKLYIADGTLKWAPHGNLKDGGVTVRGEYLVDDRDGAYTAPPVLQPDQSAFDQTWNGQRRGGYLEAVYRINRTWEAGYRYDKLVGGSHRPVRERVRSLAQQRDAELAQQRVQPGPAAIQPRRTQSIQHRQRSDPAIPGQPRRARRACILSGSEGTVKPNVHDYC